MDEKKFQKASKIVEPKQELHENAKISEIPSDEECWKGGRENEESPNVVEIVTHWDVSICICIYLY